jgi:hypothetical protein
LVGVLAGVLGERSALKRKQKSGMVVSTRRLIFVGFDIHLLLLLLTGE